MKLVVVTPHFAPDVAPTGTVVTRLVEELAGLGHRVDVVTSLPWYRRHEIEEDYRGRAVRHEDFRWGTVTRVHPFPSSDKTRFARRAAGYAAFSLLAGVVGARGGRADGVLALSPPLTLGLTGWAIARLRRAPLVFNVQDVYPDVAVDLGVLTHRGLIRAAAGLERFCYERAAAITVLADDLKENVASKVSDATKVHVIPNFIATDEIKPSSRENEYRKEFGLEGKTVVMYAGNVGLSQSLDLMLQAASALTFDDDLVFIINGQGAARPELERRARGLPNVRFVDMQPSERLTEVLAAGDIHVVPLKRGLARSSVPSKTYSIMAAGRPVVASVDVGSEIARLVETTRAGLAVPPEDAEAFTKAIRTLRESPEEAARMGDAGRAYVEREVSPTAVAHSYESLFRDLQAGA